MKDMAYTTEELTAKKAEYSSDAPIGDMPKYPWGLELNLCDEVLKKLGASLPDVGGEVTITAKCRVTGKNAREEADGDVKASTNLQIIAMQIGEEGPKEQSAVMFGNK